MEITRRIIRDEEFKAVKHALEEARYPVDSTSETNTVICPNCPEAKGIIERNAPSGTTEPLYI